MIKRNILKLLFLSVATSLVLSFTACNTPANPEEGDGKNHVSIAKPLETEESAETAESTSSAETEETVDDNTITFIAAGDNIMHQAILDDAMVRATSAFGENSDVEYYFAEMYSGIADMIKNTDIAFVNHENPTAGEEFGYSGYPNFNSPEESCDTLLELGFDVINIANNHMLDMDTVYRGTGYKNTVDFWNQKDALMIGGYENSDDYEQVRILEVKGVKIAFLAYTYGTNTASVNSGSPDYVVPYTNDSDMVRHIENAKNQADLVFVSMHWGTENTFSVSSEQKRQAQLIADAGADVIIGHHPHVIQPIEWIDGEDGNRTLCIYSLGNFISTMLNSYNMLGGLVSFDIKNDNGNFTIENVVMNPIVCHYYADPDKLDNQDLPTRYSISLYKLSDYTEELASSHGSQLYGQFTLNTLYDYFIDNIDAEFRPDYARLD